MSFYKNQNKLDFYGKIFRNLLFPFYESFLRRRNTLQYLKDAESVLDMKHDELRALQFKKLKALLEHAYKNVPYYRQLWDEKGLQPDKINCLEDFEKLPVLTKDIVRNNYDQLIADNYRGKTSTKSTGGSTGQPFTYEYTYESHKKREAIAMRGYGLAGSGLGVKTWQLWGQDLVHPGWFKALKYNLFHRFYNRKIANSFVMSKDIMQTYVDDYNNFKPSSIVAYTSPLVQLSEYIIENNISVHQPDTILTGAEPLYDFQRHIIEKAFGAKVKNTYGCREVMLIASEAIGIDELVINIDHLVVESCKDGKSVFGEVGDVVLTDLSNYGMPLIRYENGDQAIIDSLTPSDDFPLPRIRSIEGRKLDVIHTPDGKLLPGEFFPHLLKDFKFIHKFQIVQEAIDKLVINIVCKGEAKKDEERELIDIIRSHVGNDLELILNYLKEIPLTSSGKHRVTISKL